MKINLLNLRFEISEDVKKINSLNFTAEGFVAVQEEAKATYVEQETCIPPTPDESKELTIDDYRGCRKLREIQIETYSSEDFYLAEEETFLKQDAVDHRPMSADVKEELHPECSSQKQAIVLKELKPGKEQINGDGVEVPVVRPKSQSPPPKISPEPLHFYSGNPCVEKVKGILHIYKDSRQINVTEDVPRSELICMLAVPARYTIHDLLKFNGPFLRDIQFMRIIRDGSPNQYMVLVKFRKQKLADEYYNSYNNTTFNSIESDVCHLVYVGRVEMLKESENACFPVPGMTELPNCPVCLERMDESVDGILTILCNHAFHMECLDQWGDTSCPVCRYCQTPEEVADNRCIVCGSQESLWICLICGHVGCGRYVGLHAYRHFQETHHTYAMELGNNKVWDYVGDNYVHRLVQNKSDGKLVKVDEGGHPIQDDKLDALNLEYTYLLTNQLESQRLFFEDKIESIENNVLKKVHELEEENKILKDKCQELQATLDEGNKEKKQLQKKTVALGSKLEKSYHDLMDEKALNKAMTENLGGLHKRITTVEESFSNYKLGKEKEITDLTDQIQDLMFHMEAQQKLKGAEGVSQEEIKESHVVIGASESSPAGASGSGGSRSARKSRKKPR